jgi:cytochrome b subunit of formate dehydrogenase
LTDLTLKDQIKLAVHWSLIITTLIVLISGLGITEYRTVEFLTFGVLTKPLSFKLHTNTNLYAIFVLLLILHISFSVRKNKDSLSARKS